MNEKDFKELVQLAEDWHAFFLARCLANKGPIAGQEDDGVVFDSFSEGFNLFVSWYDMPGCRYKSVGFGFKIGGDGIDIYFHESGTEFQCAMEFFKKGKEIIKAYRELLNRATRDWELK